MPDELHWKCQVHKVHSSYEVSEFHEIITVIRLWFIDNLPKTWKITQTRMNQLNLIVHMPIYFFIGPKIDAVIAAAEWHFTLCVFFRLPHKLRSRICDCAIELWGFCSCSFRHQIPQSQMALAIRMPCIWYGATCKQPFVQQVMYIGFALTHVKSIENNNNGLP